MIKQTHVDKQSMFLALDEKTIAELQARAEAHVVPVEETPVEPEAPASEDTSKEGE